MQKQSEAYFLPLFLEIYLTKDTNNNIMPDAFVFLKVIVMFMRLLKQVFTETTWIYAYVVVGKG